MEPEFPGFDPSRPNEARILDYIIGGKDNFAADREAADRAIEVAPELPLMAREARKFLRRVVRFMVAEGIRQFIDVGCGLPTQGYVHEIAQAEVPGTRVAYVDIDPVVVTHASALLAANEHTVVIQADMRDPDQVLTHPDLKRVIDLSEPIGVLLVSVLAIIPDDEVARGVVTGFREAVAPGSLLGFSHAISDLRPQVTEKLASIYQDEQIVRGPRRANLRDRSEVQPLFEGLNLVDPGLVHIPAWRPGLGEPGELEPAVDPASIWTLGGVGRIRSSSRPSTTPASSSTYSPHPDELALRHRTDRTGLKSSDHDTARDSSAAVDAACCHLAGAGALFGRVPAVRVHAMARRGSPRRRGR